MARAGSPVGRAGGAVALAVGLVAVQGAGCDDPPRPWQGEPDGGVRDESRPYLPERPDGPLLGDASFADGSAEPAVELPMPSRVGGLWASCYAGFAPSREPLRDVTRLAMLCGPANGMRGVGKAAQGALTDPAGVDAIRFEARAGACYRVFAAGDSAIDHLEIEVLSSRGSRVASTSADRPWAVLDPERPFCTFDDDRFTVRLSGGAAQGRYAAWLWELP